MEVKRLVRIIVVLAAVIVVTLPFGFYRARTDKFSLRWFLAIHVPVIFVFLIRFGSHLSYAFLPLTFAAFTSAQLLGAWAGRWWLSRRSTPATVEIRATVSEGLSDQ